MFRESATSSKSAPITCATADTTNIAPQSGNFTRSSAAANCLVTMLFFRRRFIFSVLHLFGTGKASSESEADEALVELMCTAVADKTDAVVCYRLGVA
jgi:hypothetical protein